MTPPYDDPGGRRPRGPGAGSPLWRPDSGWVVRSGPGTGPESGPAEAVHGPRAMDRSRPDRPRPTETSPSPVHAEPGPEAAEDAGPAGPTDTTGRTGTGGDGAPGGDEVDESAVLRRERDEYLDMVRRVQADFENYKKRMLRQQTDLLERAGEGLVVKLLPALDAFDLTRAHLGDAAEVSPEVKALLQAADLVDDVLSKEGVEKIAETGVAFDPMVHDAVEHAPAEAGAGGSGGSPDAADAPTAGFAGPVVVEVLRPGYRWKGRVVRPAMVKVQG